MTSIEARRTPRSIFKEIYDNSINPMADEIIEYMRINDILIVEISKASFCERIFYGITYLVYDNEQWRKMSETVPLDLETTFRSYKDLSEYFNDLRENADWANMRKAKVWGYCEGLQAGDMHYEQGHRMKDHKEETILVECLLQEPQEHPIGEYVGEILEGWHQMTDQAQLRAFVYRDQGGLGTYWVTDGDTNLERLTEVIDQFNLGFQEGFIHALNWPLEHWKDRDPRRGVFEE